MCAAQPPVCHGVSYPEKPEPLAAAAASHCGSDDRANFSAKLEPLHRSAARLVHATATRLFLWWNQQKHPPRCGAPVTAFFQPGLVDKGSISGTGTDCVAMVMFPLPVETRGRRSTCTRAICYHHTSCVVCRVDARQEMVGASMRSCSVAVPPVQFEPRLSPAAYCACDCVWTCLHSS